jgi:hypothetical protein
MTGENGAANAHRTNTSARDSQANETESLSAFADPRGEEDPATMGAGHSAIGPRLSGERERNCPQEKMMPLGCSPQAH